jgi:hypothetical protein
MSNVALLAELADAGVTLTRNGDRLHYQTRAGVSIAPYRERIQEAKPALLALLRERETVAALGPDLALHWIHVSTAPVAATIPLAGWEGTIPAGCGVPTTCQTLGPCPHFLEHDRCWNDMEPA